MRTAIIAAGIALSGFVFGATTLMIASQGTTKARAQEPSNPYRIDGGPSFHTVRVVPRTDPETGCQYLITQSSRGDIATALRWNRFGRSECMQADAR